MKDSTRSSSALVQPELVSLCRAAEQLAEQRREALTSVHLLAAVAGSGCAVGDLLAERRLGPGDVLRSAQPTGTPPESLKPILARARGIMGRMGATAPAAVHVLIALLGERQSLAYRVVEQRGVDVGRLRSAAMNLGLGIVGRRRELERAEPARPELARQQLLPTPPATPAKRPPARGVTVPLFPPASAATARLTGDKPKSRPGARAAQIVPLCPPPAKPTQPLPHADSTQPAQPSEPPARTPPGKPVQPIKPAAPARSKPTPRTGAQRGKAPSAPLGRFELDPQKFPTLATVGRNLTLAAARGELDPVVGRHAEIEQALDILAKREGNNPCLVGAAGVGKTSVVRGLAQRIVEAERPGSPDDRIIIEIPVGELLAGTGVRGALATRFATLRTEIAAAEGRVVLFFDDVHLLMQSEAAEEIGSDLKLALARGELPCIGATGVDEYRKHIDSDPALARRFSCIEVEQPSREDAFLILSALAPKLEAFHHLQYDEEALALTIGWSMRYLPARSLPEKAVSIIDLAGARVRRRAGTSVGREHIAEVIAELANVPLERLLETDSDRFLRLEAILAERVVGHSHAISRIARILRRNAAGLGAQRPLGTFLLLGPTGVGKTETAKAVAEVLFYEDSAMTRIDMSEYSEPHSVAKLFGAPPGYVGHEAGGQLTEAVRRRPYQVVLLDEIEKAHTEVLTTFLAVFDEGRLTDGRGRTVDFTNTVILLTSNLGSEHTSGQSRRRVGFGSDDRAHDDLEQRVIGAARAALAPELYNRLDEVLVFTPLAREEVREVARRMLDKVARLLRRQRNVRLAVDPSALDVLLDSGGYDPTLGARPMRRTLARLVEAPLAERLLRGDIQSHDTVTLFGDAGEIEFEVEPGGERDELSGAAS